MSSSERPELSRFVGLHSRVQRVPAPLAIGERPSLTGECRPALGETPAPPTACAKAGPSYTAGTMHPLARRLAFAGVALAFASACSKPKPPTLTPRSAQVSAIKPDSVELSLVLAAHNPNSFPIVVNAVSASFELQDGTPLGSARSAASFTIPGQGDQDLPAKLDVRFGSLAALTPYALAAKAVPYRLRGSAQIGGDDLNVDVPFTIDGQLTPEQVMAASLRGAANLLAPHTP